ncbi:MAG: hypothetical protein RR263_05715 [Oscillospiraceae bacterium]
MAIIDGVTEFIKSCPLLKKGTLNVNYLGENAPKYSIDVMTVNPIIKKYPDGETQRQFLFVLASRETYDRETLANMDVAKFYEEFGEWIETQDHKRNFPTMDKGCIPTSIQVTSSGYLFAVDNKTARFQIQCKLIYNKERMM